MHHILTITYQGIQIRLTAIIRDIDGQLYYDLYRDGDMIGTIRPTLGDEPFTIWVGDDHLDPELVPLVGAAIENQDW